MVTVWPLAASRNDSDFHRKLLWMPTRWKASALDSSKTASTVRPPSQASVIASVWSLAGSGAGGRGTVSRAVVRIRARVPRRIVDLPVRRRPGASSGAGCVDVLIQSSLGQAGIVDGRRGVGRGVDVVGYVGARLVDVEAVAVVAGADLARVGAWHQVAGV